MPRTDQVEAFSGLLAELNTVQQAQLVAMIRAIEDRPADFVRDALLAEYPELIDTFAGAATDVAAQWYEELDPESTYQVRLAPLPPLEQQQATVRWAMEALYTWAPVADPLQRLAGSSQRALYNGARETLASNAEREGVRWARYASANACEFCRMVATRGDVYSSEAAAGGLSSRYHDHCRCMAVPVRAGDSYSPPSYVEEWQAEYTQARQAAGGVDATSILAAWRQL